MTLTPPARHLGKALHVVQDSYSHEGFSPPFYHALHTLGGKDPDDPTRDPAKTIRMALQTREILEQFRARCGQEAEKCCAK